MGDFGNAIKYLYSQFILRDVLSFITPGALVVLTAFLLLLPCSSLTQRLDTLFDYSTSIHWLLYIPLFGIFYLIGYAVQCLQCLFGCVRLHFTDKSCFSQRRSVFKCDWQDKTDYMKKTREETTDFLNITVKVGWARQYRERSVVLKQMSANGFGAIILASIFLLVDSFCPFQYANILVVSIVALFLLVSLLWGYRSSEFAVDTIENKVKSLKNTGKLERDE